MINSSVYRLICSSSNFFIKPLKPSIWRLLHKLLILFLLLTFSRLFFFIKVFGLLLLIEVFDHPLLLNLTIFLHLNSSWIGHIDVGIHYDLLHHLLLLHYLLLLHVMHYLLFNYLLIWLFQIVVLLLWLILIIRHLLIWVFFEYFVIVTIKNERFINFFVLKLRILNVLVDWWIDQIISFLSGDIWLIWLFHLTLLIIKL